MSGNSRSRSGKSSHENLVIEVEMMDGPVSRLLDHRAQGNTTDRIAGFTLHSGDSDAEMHLSLPLSNSTARAISMLYYVVELCVFSAVLARGLALQ